LSGLKKNLPSDAGLKRACIDPADEQLSLRRQCELLGLNRSNIYYQAQATSEEDLLVMRLLDEQYMRTPFYGTRRMCAQLRLLGHDVNRKRVQRLMRLLGIEAIYPKPRTSTPNHAHRIYPYLLKDYAITRPTQVWSADITYVPINGGFMYLFAVIDWFSRYVLSWSLSNTMDTEFCLEGLESALRQGTPVIFNTDQGSQFTSDAFTRMVESHGVSVSMDGRGRCHDNIFIERLWRSLKYEDIYLKDYSGVPALDQGIHEYFNFYNTQRLHQSLNYRTPHQVHYPELL
jgi:putative transposase